MCSHEKKPNRCNCERADEHSGNRCSEYKCGDRDWVAQLTGWLRKEVADQDDVSQSSCVLTGDKQRKRPKAEALPPRKDAECNQRENYGANTQGCERNKHRLRPNENKISYAYRERPWRGGIGFQLPLKWIVQRVGVSCIAWLGASSVDDIQNDRR